MKVITETKLSYLGKEYYIFQDKEGNVIWPATDFIISRIRDEEDQPSTLDTYRKALKRLYLFLDENNLNWLNMNDGYLGKFRNRCLELTIENPRHRGYINKARQTVNHDYLEPIYTFYYWAQKQKIYLPTLLGPCTMEGTVFQITSELPDRDEARRNGGKEPAKKFLYPKRFRNVPKNKDSKSAEDHQVTELQDYIIQNFKGYEAECLLMITRIIGDTGTRPVAMASFIKSQFINTDVEKKLFDNSRNKLEIRPLKQKGGNSMPIEFPVGTALAVRAFIKHTLEPFIQNNQYKEHHGHLFLKPNSGIPLQPNDITKIFSDITTKLGWPKGQSLYSLRHKYANDELDRELAINHELGFDTSEPVIRHQVSKKMTHRSEKSLQEYVESRQRFGAKTTASQQATKIKELEAAIANQAVETKQALEKAQEQTELAEKAASEVNQLEHKISQLELNIEKMTSKK
ncbi:MAG: hypothetical protein WBF78_06530 [Vibrio anguillarum]